MLRGAWRIGRVGGIEIRIDPSWLIIAGLLTFNLWAIFSDPSRFPELTPTSAGVLAVLSALLFFGCILAHELAHAGMSVLRNIPVSGITLFMFGGATHAKVDARGPLDEFLITVVGPLTSAALGAGFLAAYFAFRPSLSGSIQFLLGDLGVVNLTLAVFNLLPGFPLDGGRLLRSILWRVLGSLSRATVIAARVGQLMGIALIGFGVFLGVKTGDISNLWLALIGGFLFRAASETLADGARRRLLETTMAGRVMAPPPPTVPATMPLAEAMDRYLMGHEGEAFPVMDDWGGGLLGFVSLRTARAAPPGALVRDATVAPENVVVAAPSERMDQAAARLPSDRAATILVVDGGRLVGVIEPADLQRFLRAGAAPGAVITGSPGSSPHGPGRTPGPPGRS